MEKKKPEAVEATPEKDSKSAALEDAPVCTKSFDPENSRYADDDDACKNGEG
ncbi:hypothetical protein [Teretinema zuelzerae]|uniref:hypothetical protein n=1 Tax=Teretinema zuelzerae TaxID=156 RepID=UPI001E2EABDB|nr:hypothetical protein [Teretinema zuelzerae]MBN2810298.1 hypothetical protein [Spirochaetales bacterium]